MPIPKPPAPIHQLEHKSRSYLRKKLAHTTEKLHSNELAVFMQELIGIVNNLLSIFVTWFTKQEIMSACCQQLIFITFLVQKEMIVMLDPGLNLIFISEMLDITYAIKLIN